MFEKLKNVRLSPIKKIELEASKIPDAVSLAQGIPSFDTPKVIKDEVIEKILEGKVAKYSLTNGLPELRELVSQKLRDKNMYYDFDTEIIIISGAIEGISATIQAIISPLDEVLIPSPSYTSYSEIIKISGGVIKYFNLDEENNWGLDIKAIENQITNKTKVILLCNPNNPTGTIYTKDQLLKIGELLLKYNLILITDEVYIDFLYTNEEFFTLAQIEKLKKNVVRIFSFSKSYSMTGWRIGFLHSHKDNISEILKVHDSFVTCAPVVSQFAGIASLKYAEKDVKKFRDIFLKRRNITMNYLDELKDVFSYKIPNSSYFIFPKIKKQIKFSDDSWKFVLDVLNNAKVALVPGEAFGPSGEGHIRISFGREESDIHKAFYRLKKYFLNK